MTSFLVYALIVCELFFIGLYFLTHWLKYRRRFSDIVFFVLSVLLGISYLLYGFEYFFIQTKLLQIIVDIIISLCLGFFFVKSMSKELKNKG